MQRGGRVIVSLMTANEIWKLEDVDKFSSERYIMNRPKKVTRIGFRFLLGLKQQSCSWGFFFF